MDADEITRRINEIREQAWDAETAHRLEDALYGAFIKWISQTETSTGKPTYAAELATRVLAAGDIEFSRWYA